MAAKHVKASSWDKYVSQYQRLNGNFVKRRLCREVENLGLYCVINVSDLLVAFEVSATSNLGDYKQWRTNHCWF